MWQATNPTARDFRHAFHPEIVWTSTTVVGVGGDYVGSVPMPATGATAFFLELTYPSAIPGMPYVFTTDIRVNSNLPLYGWLKGPGVDSVLSELVAAPTALSAATGAVPLFALPPAGDDAETAASTATVATPSTVDPTSAIKPAVLADSPAYAPEASAESSDASRETAIDAAFDESLEEVLA